MTTGRSDPPDSSGRSALPDPVSAALNAVRLEGWSPTPAEVAVLRRDAEAAPSAVDLPSPGRAPRVTLRDRLRRRDVYLQKSGTVLRNVLGITDDDELHRAEALASARRLVQFHGGRIAVPGEGIHALPALHRHLFQDVYAWAGQVRTVEIGKGGTTFVRSSAIWDHLIDLHADVVAADWAGADHGRLAFLLARTYADLNQIHPFREGNGRAATTFLHHLLRGTDHRLDLSGVTRADWVQAARDSAPFRPSGAASARPFLPVFLRALRPVGGHDPDAVGREVTDEGGGPSS